MHNYIYLDETGTHKGAPYYSIGAIVMPSSYQCTFEKDIQIIKENEKFPNEIKWSKIHTGINLISTSINILNYILSNEKVSYSCIVVNKNLYKKWINSSRDEAFYKTLTFLIKNIAEYLDEGKTTVYCDQKNNKYDKHHEVSQIIANRMLNTSCNQHIDHIVSADSKKSIGIQVADIITGAINTEFCRSQDDNFVINRGKDCCLKLMSKVLGWDSLHYDTYPNKKFNIWCFPIETRAPGGSSKKYPCISCKSKINQSEISNILNN